MCLDDTEFTATRCQKTIYRVTTETVRYGQEYPRRQQPLTNPEIQV